MYSVFARISFAVDEAVGESARSETGGSTEQETETRSLSDHCFVALLWAVMLVQLWQRLWLIQLIPLLLFYLLLKKLGELGPTTKMMWSNNTRNTKINRDQIDIILNDYENIYEIFFLKNYESQISTWHNFTLEKE